MKLSALQLITGLGLTSPFDIVPIEQFISESDGYSEDESESDAAWEQGLEESISLSPSSPQLPDLVMSTQQNGDKKIYAKATPRSALVSKKTDAQQKPSVSSQKESDPLAESQDEDSESTGEMSKGVKPTAVAKKMFLPRKQILKPIPDELDEVRRPKPNLKESLAKKTPRKNKPEDSTFDQKPQTSLNSESGSYSGRLQRKRTRPKRFEEAFEELESLAKKYKQEKEQEDSETSINQEESEAEDEGIESEDTEVDERSELEKDLEAFQPKVVLNRVENGSADGRFYCSRCRKNFRSNSEYEKHQTSPMCLYRCVECQVSFKNEEILKEHIETEHQPLAALKKTLELEKEAEESASPVAPEDSDSEEAPTTKKTPRKLAPKSKQMQSKKTTAEPRTVDLDNAPRRCCVKNCPKIPGIAKYLCTFPKEPELSEKWEKKIEKANKKRLTPLDVYVCSKHFKEELYMGSGLLKPGSVPSVFSDPKKRKS